MIEIGGPAEHTFAEPLHLLSDCHRRIEMFLGRMILAVDRYQGGPLPENARRALETSLHYFRHAAPLHKADEEQSLFPRLQGHADPRLTPMLGHLAALEAEHQTLDAGHDDADRLLSLWLDQGELSADKLSQLQALLADLQGRYQTHIAFEDGQLLPLAAVVLDAGQVEAIGREMAARRGIPFPHP
jgi:hemerythrin-like domain-containing protein